ncbi:MAG: hypothetical protein A2Y93_01345 [Chloroflexi bacterium RBG_13_68_17]|nr:MAG: hypothetical protein A2Y93_01345 [Chloroflexi bacterium RBG_13_68_17]
MAPRRASWADGPSSHGSARAGGGTGSVTTIGLTILHTNDMHGRLEAMARLSSLAGRLRTATRAAGREVLLWDAGDALDRRDRLCGLSKGAALARVLNAMGYDLMTMGNDILLTYGPAAMAELVSRLTFPVLAANCRDGQDPPAAGLRESVLVRLSGGPLLGVVGVTAPWGGLYESFGLRFPDAHATVARVAQQLRADGAAVVVVLSHLGQSEDVALARSVPGIDLIVGAHSHDLLEHGREENGVLIVQAGQFAEALGVVDLELDAGSGSVVARSARIERVDEGEAPDSAVQDAIAEAAREVDALAARLVGFLLDDLELDDQGECSLGNLAADALRERMGAEAACLISGQFHSGLRAGSITFGDLCRCSSITANPQLTHVRGTQILEMLERSLDPASRDARPPGLRGPKLGWLQISGLRVVYDPRKPVGEQVAAAFVGDSSLDPQRTYRLAHTDAETQAESPLLKIEPGQETRTEVPTITREFVEDYIRARSPVGAPPCGRWIRRGDAA